MNWGVMACAEAGSLAVVLVRPWRFFWARERCPQCKNLLARWGVWGWKEDWACGHCGCLVNR